MATHFLSLADHHRFGLYAKAQAQPQQRIDECDKYDPNKPTVIILPGTRVNHELPRAGFARSMFGMIGLVRRSLERTGNDANVLCAVYGHNDEQSVANHFSFKLPLKHPGYEGSPAGADIHDFVDNTLLPFMGVSKNARPTVDEAAQKLSKLTLVGNSYGTAFAQEAGRLLSNRLQDHGYSAADAARLTSELVVLNTGNMANLDANDVHLRSITFAADRDQTTWETMQRIAEDHIRDRFCAPDADPDFIRGFYYKQCGFDDARMLDSAVNAPYRTVLGLPARVQNGHGLLVRFAAPTQLHLTTAKGIIRTDRAALDAECTELNEGLKAFQQPLNGVNGEPLARPNLAIEHDVRMYFGDAEENTTLRESVDRTLSGCVTRSMLPPSRDLEDSLHSLMHGPQPKRVITAIQHGRTQQATGLGLGAA